MEDAHFVLRVGDYPERIFAIQTTANIFPMMGLRAALGRTLSSSENQSGHENVAVLSDAIWRGRFGSDRTILGKSIVLDGRNYQVVGVLADNAQFSLGYPQTPDIWVPLPLAADPARNTGRLEMVALKKFRHAGPSFSDLLPYAGLVDNGILLLKDGYESDVPDAR